MTDAAKSAGNECTRSGNHTWGMEFYSLAIFLDASNLAALCNRANSYHMVSPSAVLGVPCKEHSRECWTNPCAAGSPQYSAAAHELS